jgi:iron complex transport system permease protein
MTKHGTSALFILVLLLIAVIPVCISVGSSDISPALTTKILLAQYLPMEKTWDPECQELIIIGVRLPRVLLAGLVGAALATAGCAMQGLLKNPMADPYIIGISSGAGLGAALSMYILHLPVQLLSFILALITILIVYNISKITGKVQVDTLLLAGIAVGFLLNAITSLIMVMERSIHELFTWLMGGFWTADWEKVKITFILVIVGIVLIYRYAWSLNVMLMGEEQAQYLGVNIEQVKLHVLILSSLITAAAVSVSGLIGFVGLIIPHIMRIIVGPDHRILFPASTLMGAIFLLLADTSVRTVFILNEGELPVGIITAMFGAPFFIYLLRKRRKNIYA